MSVVTRISASRGLLARAYLPTKSAASRGIITSVGATLRCERISLAPQSLFRTAVIAKKSLWEPVSGFKNFHVSAMAFDSEVNEGAPVAEAESFESFTPQEQTPAPPGNKLYIGNLSWNINGDELRTTFESYGDVQSCDVVMDVNGRSRGFAFVEFASVDQCQAAITGLNSELLDGREMRVDFHQPRDRNAPRPERPRFNRYQESGNRVYVGNLPWTFDDFDLQDTFEEFGTVVDAKVIIDRETGRSRGFGFVTLSNEEEVDKSCAELDGSICEGRSIRVNKAER